MYGPVRIAFLRRLLDEAAKALDASCADIDFDDD
jgi:hypothetical protein